MRPFVRKLNRVVCMVKDHEMAAMTHWEPEFICMHFVCLRCGKEMGQIKFPDRFAKPTAWEHVPKEKMN